MQSSVCWNTSQAYSECGLIVKKELKHRVHSCSCGYTEDRDINAAKNILKKSSSLNRSQAWNVPSRRVRRWSIQ
ncbi:zinc ribbon domain-containing protein [Polycladospora coralii]|uniref:zinc ribbon domain-containing protein n=1 Tax=Polycladospora coralii TaxID=2771432 RepID=UPI0034E2743D